MYCANDSNFYQYKCGGIGKYIEGCPNETLPNNLKNYNNMHLCKVKIILEVYLAQFNSTYPLKLKILNTYLLSNVLITYTSQINWLNLTQQVYNNMDPL